MSHPFGAAKAGQTRRMRLGRLMVIGALAVMAWVPLFLVAVGVLTLLRRLGGA